jgi:hypothetical protein
LRTATISGSTISGNTAVYGGSIYADATVGALTVTGSTLSGNSATYGGGICAFGALTVANATGAAEQLRAETESTSRGPPPNQLPQNSKCVKKNAERSATRRRGPAGPVQLRVDKIAPI